MILKTICITVALFIAMFCGMYIVTQTKGIESVLGQIYINGNVANMLLWSIIVLLIGILIKQK